MTLNRRFLPKLIRGLVSLFVLLGICAMLFPLPFAPLPQNSPEKDGSEPFPCQSRPCGCQSAKQCWKKCCCFSNVQKVAWAKANNVKVPDFVLAAARLETEDSVSHETCSFSSSSDKTLTAKAAAACEHCSKISGAASESSCCQKTREPKTRVSGTSKSARCESCGASSVSRSKVQSIPAKSKWVLAIYATECQGQGPSAFCFPTSIVPERITLVILPVAVIESLSVESERLLQASPRPPLPPPKIA